MPLSMAGLLVACATYTQELLDDAASAGSAATGSGGSSDAVAGSGAIGGSSKVEPGAGLDHVPASGGAPAQGGSTITDAGTGSVAAFGGEGGEAGASPAVCVPKTLQLPVVFDAGIAAASSSNEGMSSELCVSRAGAAASQRGLLWVDLSPLPAGSTITAAELELTVLNNTAATRTLEVHRVTRRWAETQVTWVRAAGSTDWSMPGGDFEPAPSTSQLITFALQRGSVLSLPVLADTLDWYREPSTNTGWLLKDADESIDDGSAIFFATHDYLDGTFTPRLSVSYCL